MRQTVSIKAPIRAQIIWFGQNRDEANTDSDLYARLMTNQHSELQPLTNNRLTREETSPRDLHVVPMGGGLKKRVSLAEVGREEETQTERVLL